MKTSTSLFTLFTAVLLTGGCECNPEPEYVILPELNQEELPVVDYRSSQSPVKQQGGRGTCTAFGVAAVLETFPGIPSDVSEQYLYGTLKKLKRDLGGQITPGDFAINYKFSMAQYGLASEADVPYDPACFKWSTDDQEDVRFIRETCAGLITICTQYLPYAQYPVLQDAIDTYPRGEAVNVQRIIDLLNSGVKAVAVGYDLYDEDIRWQNNNGKPSGAIHFTPNYMPNSGHVVTIVGYNSNSFLIKNSWGESWGDRGYGYIGFDYHSHYANELLVIRNVYPRQFPQTAGKLYPLRGPANFRLKSVPVTGNAGQGIEVSLLQQQTLSEPYNSVTYRVYFNTAQGYRVLVDEKEILCSISQSSSCPALMLTGKNLPQTENSGYEVEAELRFAGGSTFSYSFRNLVNTNREYESSSLYY